MELEQAKAIQGLVLAEARRIVADTGAPFGEAQKQATARVAQTLIPPADPVALRRDLAGTFGRLGNHPGRPAKQPKQAQLPPVQKPPAQPKPSKEPQEMAGYSFYRALADHFNIIPSDEILMFIKGITNDRYFAATRSGLRKKGYDFVKRPTVYGQDFWEVTKRPETEEAKQERVKKEAAEKLSAEMLELAQKLEELKAQLKQLA